MTVKKPDFFTDLEDEASSRRCVLGRSIRAMDSSYREQVVSVLSDPTRRYNSAWISRALHKRGFAVSERQIQRCRKCCECGAIPKVDHG